MMAVPLSRGMTARVDDEDHEAGHQLHHPCPPAGRPGLNLDLLDHNVHGEDVVAFLKELHRDIPLRSTRFCWGGYHRPAFL